MKQLLLVLLITTALFGKEPEVYQTIPDLKHPRMCDWVAIQRFLSRGERSELRLLDQAIDPGGALYDYRCRVRRFKLIGEHFWQRPRSAIIPIGCGQEDRDICVITYASFNKNYPQAVSLLQKQLEQIGFRGHFFYRIGGWPNLEEGGLRLAHVPYAFKPCMFEEARRLGYKQILWLDASIRPLKSLDAAFEKMKNNGYFFYPSGTFLAPYCTKSAAEVFDLSIDQVRKIPSLGGGIVGLDVSHRMGIETLERWMRAARGEIGFLSPRPEQNALSMIAYQLGLNDWESGDTISYSEESNSTITRFFVDYRSVQ